MELIVALADGREAWVDDHDFDIQVGGDNEITDTFEVRYDYQLDAKIPKTDYRIYIPWTEYGGPVGKIQTSSSTGTVMACGWTWRGLLRHKIIQPDEGAAYYTVSGTVSSVISDLIDRLEIGTYFTVQSDLPDDWTVSSYRFNRYTDADTGLRAMMASIGLKMTIVYDPDLRQAVIGATNIDNYAAEVEISSDGELSLDTEQAVNGVNHLVCLGKGELADRMVVHIYTNRQGQVLNAQSLTGIEEIMAVYENSAAENEEALRKNGLDRLKDICSRTTIGAEVGRTRKDLLLDDVISGRDYVTGLSVSAPIGTVIVTRDAGEINVQYALEEE